MSRSLQIAALLEADGDLAFPLVQASFPNVTLALWRAYVRRQAQPVATDAEQSCANGILAMRDAGGGICGVLAYRQELDLVDGQTLTVPLFAVGDLANSHRLTDSLLDVAIAQARALQCQSLHIHLAHCQATLADHLENHGQRSLCRFVEIHLMPATRLE